MNGKYVLEAFKDLSIAIVLLIASSRIDIKAMLIGLVLVSAVCISMYFGNFFERQNCGFCYRRFLCIDKSISVFAIGTITENQQEHNSLMSSIEGVFMIEIAFSVHFLSQL
jgi:hypothetical protein